MLKKIVLLLTVSIVANADQLDDKLAKINLELNPKIEGSKGIKVEFRQDNGFAWLNIERVIKQCDIVDIIHLKNNKVIKNKENICNIYTDDNNHTYTNVLFQIICKTKTVNNCKEILNKELSSKIINQIVNDNLKNVYLTDK